MRIGPKYKICKRLGASVFEKCQTAKYQLAEARAPRKISAASAAAAPTTAPSFLRSRRARFTYGLTESQFYRYASEAMEKHGKDSSLALLSRLEARLITPSFAPAL